MIIALENYSDILILNSSLHEYWSWKYSSTMGTSTIRYTPTSAFETFPFPRINSPQMEKRLEIIGKNHYEHRQKLMMDLKLGLTKTYNAFHTKEISDIQLGFSELCEMSRIELEKEYGKEFWNLWNHLQKTEGTCRFEEAVKGILKLRELHIEMDNTILDAYGWQDIDFKHDFYEVEYLPENDRIRFTIHPDARKEILKRLLDLNHKIHEEEVKAGLWDKKTGTKKSENEKSTGDQVNEPEEGYGGLFGLT